MDLILLRRHQTVNLTGNAQFVEVIYFPDSVRMVAHTSINLLIVRRYPDEKIMDGCAVIQDLFDRETDAGISDVKKSAIPADYVPWLIPRGRAG